MTRKTYVIKNKILDNVEIGQNCTIWDFVNIYNSTIGNDVNIGAFTEIQKATIGNRCRIGAGCFIPSGVIIGNNCFIGPKVCFITDKYPTVDAAIKNNGDFTPLKPTIIEDGAIIGANSTILQWIRIGKNAKVGAGSIVTKDVPDNKTWIGRGLKNDI